MNTLRFLPHLLTLANLAAGCLACIFLLLPGTGHLVVWCLLVSAVADFLDGFAARAAGVSGDFGKELDSLADMVSFGVVPALMAVTMLSDIQATYWFIPTYAYGGIFIAVMSAVRLARFNTSQADTKHFIGLATPSNTLFWLGLYQVWLLNTFGLREELSNPWLLLPLVALFGYLLVSDLTLFSNKLNPLAARNWPVWIVLTAALILPWFIGWLAVPVFMSLYVLSGLIWEPHS